MEHQDALYQDSWGKMMGDAPFRYASNPPFDHDVKNRIPAVGKVERGQGFKADTSLDRMLDIVIPWVEEAIEAGRI